MMIEYKVLNDRIRKPSTKVIAVIFGIFLIVAGVFLDSIFGIIVGPIIIWSSFFAKYTIVNTEGITVNYDARMFKYKEEWRFDEVTNLHRETLKDPNYSSLHFTKGAMSKRLVFSKGDAQKIIDMAINRNEKIYFEEAN